MPVTTTPAPVTTTPAPVPTTPAPVTTTVEFLEFAHDLAGQGGPPADQLGDRPLGRRLAVPGRGGRVRPGRGRTGERWRHRNRADADRVPARRDGVVLCARAAVGGWQAGDHPPRAHRHRDG